MRSKPNVNGKRSWHQNSAYGPMLASQCQLAARAEIRKRPNLVLFDVLSTMDQEARYLLEQAERCRRIAARVSDAETAALFQVMAEEYEAKAVSLAKDHESRKVR
jgi:hypothetical protein